MKLRPFLSLGLLSLLALPFSLISAQGAELSLATAQPDLQVKLRFKPGKLTATAAESVRFYIDVKNIGPATFVPHNRSTVVISTVNGNGVEFPKKTFRLGTIKSGQTVTFQYNYDKLWPVEHCFAKYIRAKANASDANPGNNMHQITGESVSQAIAKLLQLQGFKAVLN